MPTNWVVSMALREPIGAFPTSKTANRRHPDVQDAVLLAHLLTNAIHVLACLSHLLGVAGGRHCLCGGCLHFSQDFRWEAQWVVHALIFAQIPGKSKSICCSNLRFSPIFALDPNPRFLVF